MKVKKFIAGMMLSASALGAIGVITAGDVVVNSQEVSAAEKFNITSASDAFNAEDQGTYLEVVYDCTGKGLVAEFTQSGQFEVTINFHGISAARFAFNGSIYTTNNGTSTFTIFINSAKTLKLQTFEGDYGDNVSASISIREIIVDQKAPVLETQVFLADVDNPMTLDYILSQVEFRDEVDGVLTPVIVSDNYTPNMNKVGKWNIEVKATDKAGNTGTGTIQVWVQDKTSPIITGKSTYTSNMSAPLTEASIRSQLSASDNVDGDISNKIQVVNDGFTGNENKKGSYTITYKVVDTAGNESVTYTTTISVIDDVKPVISVKDGYNDTYTSSYKNTISLDTIKESLIVTDNVDSNLTLELIEDKYTNSSSIPGTYTISFRATDTAGNISEVKVITIEVNDKIPPVFYANGYFIGVSQANTLSHQDLVNLLLYMQGLQNEGASVQILSTEYDVESVNSPGVYALSYRIMRADGEVSQVQEATIKVLGEEQIENNDAGTQIDQTGNKLKDSIKKVFDGVVNFVKNLFNTIVTYLGFGWLWDKEGNFKPNW